MSTRFTTALTATLLGVVLAQGASAQCEIESLKGPLSGKASYGFFADSHGDLLVVGANREQVGALTAGAVHVYLRDEAGTPADAFDDVWIELQRLVASDPQGGARFGTRVRIQEDLIVVAANKYGSNNYGKVYFFARDDMGTPGNALDDDWIEIFSIAKPASAYDQEFGVGLGLAGGTVVVGTEEEKAWIYERLDNGTPGNPFDDTWTETKYLFKTTGNRFAWSLDFDGETILFGARREDVGSLKDAGSVYVYDRDDMGTADPLDDDWIETAVFTANTPLQPGRFGRDVALHGDTALVGAVHSLTTGLAYVFERDRNGTPADPTDDTWIETAILAAPDGTAGDDFGIGVSLNAERALVGAHHHDLGDLENAGAAYVYARDDNGTPGDPFDDLWPFEVKLISSQAAAHDEFGIYPHHAGAMAYVGAPGHPDPAKSLRPGSLFVWDLEAHDVLVQFQVEDDLFTPLVDGQDVSGAEEFGRSLTIDGLSAAGLSAAMFDSNPLGPNAGSLDPDLLIDQGNLLILQQRPKQSVAGIYDNPDDDRYGGDLTLEFLGDPVMPICVDLVDVDPIPFQDVTIVLHDHAGRTRTYLVPSGWTEDIAVHGPPGVRTLDLQTLLDQPGFLVSAIAFQDRGFDSKAVLRMTVHVEGSAALDDLRFRPMPTEPIARWRNPKGMSRGLIVGP